MIPLGPLGRVKQFLGLFNLTAFEEDLIRVLRDSVDEEIRQVLDDQISSFNQVQRILVNDERITSGSTTFYWSRFGKSLIHKFPKRIPEFASIEEFTFFRCVVRDSAGNEIQVDYQAVYGVFVNLEYWSQNRTWYPKGKYSIVRQENLLPSKATSK